MFSKLTLSFTAFFVTFLFCFSSLANNISLNPNLIKKEIREKGVERFISSYGYNNNIKLWEVIESKIASGDEDWISIGFGLLKDSDAGLSEGLLIDLGQSLNKNPAKVLYGLKDLKYKYGERQERILNICGSTLNEFNDSPNYIPTKDIQELIKRKNLVSKVADPNLNLIKKECVKSIDVAITGLKKLETK